MRRQCRRRQTRAPISTLRPDSPARGRNVFQTGRVLGAPTSSSQRETSATSLPADAITPLVCDCASRNSPRVWLSVTLRTQWSRPPAAEPAVLSIRAGDTRDERLVLSGSGHGLSSTGLGMFSITACTFNARRGLARAAAVAAVSILNTAVTRVAQRVVSALTVLAPGPTPPPIPTDCFAGARQIDTYPSIQRVPDDNAAHCRREWRRHAVNTRRVARPVQIRHPRNNQQLKTANHTRASLRRERCRHARRSLHLGRAR